MTEPADAGAEPVLRRLARPLANKRFRWVLIAVALPLPLIQYFFVTAQLSLDLVNRRYEDFWVYLRAAAAIASGADPYAGSSGTSIVHNTGYIYPPLLAWLAQPFNNFHLGTQALIGWAVLQLCLFGALVIVKQALCARWEMTALVALAAITSYWVRRDLFEGQVDLVILLLVAVWFWAWVRGGDWWGGVALAAAVAMKVVPVVLLLLPLARRRWQMLVAAIVAGLALFLTLLPLNVEYATKVLPYLPGVSGDPESQSPASMLLRILEPDALYGRPDQLGSWFHFFVVVVALGFAAATAWWLRSPAVDWPSRAVEGAAGVALLPLLTPVTWGHHLVIELIPLFVLTWVAIQAREPKLGLLAFLAWILANPVHLVFMSVYLNGNKTPVLMNIWVELPVVGIVMLWWLCLTALRVAPRVSVSR